MCAGSQSPIGDMGDDDPDNPLRERLRERIESKSEPENTESEGDGGGGKDDDDPEDDDPEEMEMNMGEDAKQGVQMIAESLGVEPGEVEDTLMPLMGDGDDDTDDPSEMAAEDAVSEETVEEKIDEATEGVVSEDELEEKLEATRNELVDALGGEVRDVIQESNVGSTPSPDSTGGGSGGVQLFSDGGDDGGDK